MSKEVRAAKEELLKMCWYMRGGVTLMEIYNTDYEEREIIANIIEQNLETTKKTGMAFF